MRELEVRITNRLGLHARAAARFVQCAQRFGSRITVSRDAERADGKSILGLLTLAAARGTSLRLRAEGEDEAEALDELANLVRDGFGEER
jgi:phosphocarrier protein